MDLSDEPTTAEMDPWLVVDLGGEDHLFGDATWHPNTGGLSWVLSTEIIELDVKAGRARTASGRVYRLGREIGLVELDEEAVLAMHLLTGEPTVGLGEYMRALSWVSACKMARHLSLEPPRRDDPAAVQEFLNTHVDLYQAKLAQRLSKHH